MKHIPLFGKHGVGKAALVDDIDYIWASKFRWTLSSNGYATRSGHGKNFRLHREIGLSFLVSHWIDHANRNKLDNQRKNLRACSPSQNHVNTVYKPNKSGYRGVSWHRQNGSWMARVKKDGRQLASYHPTAIEAARAYNARAVEVYGEFAIINVL